MRKLLVTGGAGFIGSSLVRHVIRRTGDFVVNVDKLTYAGNLDSLNGVLESPRHRFEQADICDAAALHEIFVRERPDAVIHLAAESHVDRSIDGPAEFVQTNVVGTYTLLNESLRHWRSVDVDAAKRFRFLHVSTDEVFGSLGPAGTFDEQAAYRPNSPYAASKAAADHLVRAWFHTYGLPVITTNCSNNYGPYQFPEKLLPLTILNALSGKPLPVYGRGENVRDWLYVEDHVAALLAALDRGVLGQTYVVGGRSERSNIDVVRAVCALVDELVPDARIGRREGLIQFVPDRPGHDLRYAVDPSKIERELGWLAREKFESGLRKTVQWYLENQRWCERVQSGAYRGERLGLGVGVPA